MEYRTIVGVEIATVGMEWHASSGDHSVTFENLAAAVTAANDDPHIVVPRVKIGHTSEVNGELSVVNPFSALGDAEPAFGRYVNLRLTNNGATLIGDWIEGPEWLVDAAPSAYPGRSMEARTDIVTEGGKRYSMVIVAVSLLGPIEPAIKDLEDLERFLIEGPTNVTTAATRPEEDGMSEQVDASVSAATIRERFNFDWATSEPIDGMDTYWWWARDVRVDPNEVIADDDEGNCWSIPYETDGKDGITFGEPVKVREEFVPVTASATSVVANFRERKEQRVLASNLERPEKPAPKPAAFVQPDNEEDTMDAKAIRESLGLAEDATDEEVIAKGQELREAAETEETTEEETTEETPETEAVEEPVAASVDPDALEQLRSDAAAGREARTTQLSAERDGLIAAAVKAGKFAPAVAASYRAQLDKGGDIEASTRKFIEELADDVVPVTEMGASHENDQGHVGRVLASFGINRG
jgi:hypothetical protein